MTETTYPPITGHCLCGAVSVTATPIRDAIEACHCDMCRRWGGGPYLAVQCATEFTFAGEQHIARFQSSDWAERGFCKQCGSHLFYHFKPTGTHSFLAGLFDNPGTDRMGEQIFIDEKPPYYTFSDDAPARTGAEVITEAKEAGFSFD